jgi:hypothetical protein
MTFAHAEVEKNTNIAVGNKQVNFPLIEGSFLLILTIFYNKWLNIF